MKDETAQRIGSYAINKYRVRCLHHYRCTLNRTLVLIRHTSSYLLRSQASSCHDQTYRQNNNLFHKAFIYFVFMPQSNGLYGRKLVMASLCFPYIIVRKHPIVKRLLYLCRQIKTLMPGKYIKILTFLSLIIIVAIQGSWLVHTYRMIEAELLQVSTRLFPQAVVDEAKTRLDRLSDTQDEDITLSFLRISTMKEKSTRRCSNIWRYSPTIMPTPFTTHPSPCRWPTPSLQPVWRKKGIKPK